MHQKVHQKVYQRVHQKVHEFACDADASVLKCVLLTSAAHVQHTCDVSHETHALAKYLSHLRLVIRKMRCGTVAVSMRNHSSRCTRIRAGALQCEMQRKRKAITSLVRRLRNDGEV